MYRSPAFSYRHHPSTVILKGRASACAHNGERFELRWFRYVTEDGEVTDVLHQQHWSRRCGFVASHLGVDYRSTAAETFDRLVELYQRVNEQADGTPPPGQLSLPGLS